MTSNSGSKMTLLRGSFFIAWQFAPRAGTLAVWVDNPSVL